MIAQDFVGWSRGARRGARVVYFTGNLAFARQDTRDPRQRSVNALANVAYAEHQFGRVSLAQRRIGPDSCEYIATRL